MRLYRITKEKYLTNFSGRGKSFLDGARWNSPGIPVLYFACTPSVALLEMANYIISPRLVPKSYRFGIYELPDTSSSKTLSIGEMPSDWTDFPYPLSTQIVGSEWLLSNESLCLIVPSVAVPAGMENIAVVNPSHPEIKDLKLTSIESDLYNKRAFRGI
ncbi:MAG: RES family NAD+ phosphorylase [Cyanobacteria bacterium J06631_2]